MGANDTTTPVKAAGRDGQTGAAAATDTQGATTTQGTRRSLWKGTDYGTWFVADTTTTLSSSILGFALPLIAQSATGSATLASLMNSITNVTSGALSLPGGYLQDKVDRRKLLVIHGLAGLVMFAAAGALLGFTSLGYWVLVALAVLMGARTGLLGNTSNAMLRGMIPDEQYATAMSLNYSRDSVVELIGSPIGGVLLVLGSWVPLAAGALLSACGALASLRIKRYWRPGDPELGKADDGAGDTGEGTDTGEAPVAGHPAEPRTLRAQMKGFLVEATGGLKWMLTTPFMLRLAIASQFAFPCVNALLLQTTLSLNRDGTPQGVAKAATLNSVMAVAMLVGAFLANVLVNRVRSGVLAVAVFVLLPIGVLGTTLADGHFLVQVAILSVILLVLPSCNAAFGGFMGLLISRRNQGRAGAAEMLIGLAASALITLLAGVLVDWLGYRDAGLILAAMTLAFILPAVTLRSLATLPKPDGWKAHIASHPDITTF